MKRFAVMVAACAAVAIGLGVYEAAADNGGTISGTVKYDGAVPAEKKVDITKDKDVCGLKPHFEEGLIVSSSGGIANAVVVLKDAKGTVKPQEVKFDQKGCDYSPHVLAFPAGSTVDIMNDDGILHNIHTYSTVNPPFNMAQPKFKKEIQKVIDKPEIIKVNCDAHGWMHGWWYVTDTPYFAVSDDSGNFTIKDVPPGTYTIEVWQEKLGTQDQKVDVKAGATATSDFSLKPKG
ncbi:MAG TPA: carboxypeptidase regulatory-like domain-containing protein [Candidatus Binataceae bacterium]|nr:carboxypeptidase regulatory-like domain-containing protein [Candidatus Binataceae bacterium]